MIKRFFSKSKETLEEELKQTDAKLALLKVQLAAQMVRLARQTDDLEPLKQADDALAEARDYFPNNDYPVEVLIVHQAMAETCLSFGRARQDKSVILQAKIYFRAAITLASMRGEDKMRADMRSRLVLIDSLLGQRPKAPSLFSAA